MSNLDRGWGRNVRKAPGSGRLRSYPEWVHTRAGGLSTGFTCPNPAPLLDPRQLSTEKTVFIIIIKEE
jgi:hypothetical protein